ncbi:MAG: pyridine nucleotide-disulfide oxidoreductase, partial [Clostridia bacterium]|nr:pyridine nucleotide-disulfide oxidoreductase [Clostridia bacterium]
MPEQCKDPKVTSKYQGEPKVDECYVKLGKKITDVVAHKIGGLKSSDPEYWGLKEVLTPEMCEVCLKMKLRKYYTFEELLKMNKGYEPTKLRDLYEQMSDIGIIEYDYGANYDHDGELKDKPRVKRYRLPFFVPGSAELMNSTGARSQKTPV